MAKQRVLLIGATGNTGKSILNGLLEYGKYDVESLVRPASTGKPEVKKIAERGVKIVVADINDPVDDLMPIFQGVDVIITAISTAAKLAKKNLANAAKRADVKRFIPCSWATIAPPEGVMLLRTMKEEVFNHIKKLYLPYTIIDVGYWHQISYPRVPSGRFDSAILLPHNEIHGDGNTPNMLSDLRDIGRWTARIIEDERTLNKYVYAYSDVLSENQVVAAVEKISGEKLSVEKAKAELNEARANSEKDPNNGLAKLMRAKAEYACSKHIRGDNQPAYGKYLGYLDARELYPDLKPITFLEFLKDLQAGKIEKPYYDFGPALTGQN
ncbi:putative isoflavone reductase family protein [Botryosphaeria dothidea]|uniref:Isoflavone reductase family protein n=1 Tax=Botryosphaeria dothidea TaxID=55169 RepID=A0A8H4NAJ2_9PEZI|nr:putative isoflavone reductase family protein [Botryosphaeria dothidea]